jgi:hypothetical protein
MLKKKYILLLLFCLFNPHSSSGTYITNGSFTLEIEEFGSIDFYADPDYDYYIDIEVTSGGAVDIFLMDGYDYADYFSETAESFSYYTIGSDLSSHGITYEFYVENGIQLYIVIENADFTIGGAYPYGDVTVSIKIDEVLYVADSGGSSSDEPETDSNLLAGLLVIGVVIGGVLLYKYYQKKKKERVYQPMTNQEFDSVYASNQQNQYQNQRNIYRTRENQSSYHSPYSDPSQSTSSTNSPTMSSGTRVGTPPSRSEPSISDVPVTKFCHGCGSKVTSIDKFCTVCGTKL